MQNEEGRRIVRANVSSEMSTRGWNVVDLARAARIDVGTAGDFLNGSRWPQRATQNRIEEAVDWHLGTIYNWEHGLPGSARPEDYERLGHHRETVADEQQDVGVLLSMPPEALEGLGPAEREEVIAAARLSGLRAAREIRRRLDAEIDDH